MVFQADIDSIYNFYIDTIGTTSGDVEFCFQTVSGKLVKTDINGSIIGIESNPYKYFTIYDGDSLVLSKGSVIKGGDIIATASDTLCRLIAASPVGIYVYYGGDIDSRGVAWSWQVQNVSAEDSFDKIILYSTPISGLSVYQDSLYVIQYLNKRIYSVNVNNPKGRGFREISSIGQPVGIAGYKGQLYVFSNADKTLYRLEISGETGTPVVRTLVPRPKWINLGGGEVVNDPGFATPRAIAAVKALKALGSFEAMIEPSEYMVRYSGSLVAHVLDVIRRKDKDIAVLDVSASCHATDLLLFDMRADVLSPAHSDTGRRTILGCVSCLAGDVIGEYKFAKPLEVGDIVVFGGLGCYSFAQQSWFNGIPHPDVVLVSKAEGERKVLSWDYQDYLREFLGRGS